MPDKAPTKRKAISKKMRFEVFKRDSFTCQYCGRKAPDVTLEIDHIEPISKGGKNSLDNYTTSCTDCNMGKNDNILHRESAEERELRLSRFFDSRLKELSELSEINMRLACELNHSASLVIGLLKELSCGAIVCENRHLPSIRQMIAQFGLDVVERAISCSFLRHGDNTDTVVSDAFDDCSKIKMADERLEATMEKITSSCFCVKRKQVMELLLIGYKKHGEAFYDKVVSCINERAMYWPDLKLKMLAAINEVSL